MGSDLYLMHRQEAQDNYPRVCRELAEMKAEASSSHPYYEKYIAVCQDKDQLRKQVLAYQSDLGLARKILYFIKLRTRDKMVRRVVTRCLEELKQTS